MLLIVSEMLSRASEFGFSPEEVVDEMNQRLFVNKEDS